MVRSRGHERSERVRIARGLPFEVRQSLQTAHRVDPQTDQRSHCVIQVEVKKLAIERMREEERREHPKERERERAKKRAQEELERNFHQKEEYWLKREREKVLLS